jgi:hypothetical protein
MFPELCPDINVMSGKYLQAVVFTVNNMYNPIVPTATPAYCHPNLYPYISYTEDDTNIPETIPISSKVGAI